MATLIKIIISFKLFKLHVLVLFRFALSFLQKLFYYYVGFLFLKEKFLSAFLIAICSWLIGLEAKINCKYWYFYFVWILKLLQTEIYQIGGLSSNVNMQNLCRKRREVFKVEFKSELTNENQCIGLPLTFLFCSHIFHRHIPEH